MIRKVNAVVLFVQDLEKVVSFYRDVVGVEIIYTDETSSALRLEGQDFAIITIPNAVGMLDEETVGANQGAGHRFMMCTDVDDVDATYTILTGRGLKFIKGPVDQPWGWRAAYFTDPEGNIWELRQAIPAK